MPDSDAPPTLFHVEEQEVIYWTSVIDAANKDIARMLIVERKQGELVGHQLVSRLVTNVHPVGERCTEMGCYQKGPSKEAP